MNSKLLKILFDNPDFQPLPENYSINSIIKCFGKPSSNSKESTDLNSNLLEKKPAEKAALPPFFSREVLFSPIYISTVLFFMLNVFRIYVYLGTMGYSTAELIAADQGCSKEEADLKAGSMVTSFGVVQFCGVLFAPINGIVIDSSMFKFDTHNLFHL